VWRPVVGSILGGRGAQLNTCFLPFYTVQLSRAMCGEDLKAVNIAFGFSMWMVCL
jgi:hypothetical protein